MTWEREKVTEQCPVRTMEAGVREVGHSHEPRNSPRRPAQIAAICCQMTFGTKSLSFRNRDSRRRDLSGGSSGIGLPDRIAIETSANVGYPDRRRRSAAGRWRALEAAKKVDEGAARDPQETGTEEGSGTRVLVSYSPTTRFVLLEQMRGLSPHFLLRLWRKGERIT